jgi:hypothetical protein
MPEVIPFSPSNIAAPQFTATLDNNPYNIIVTWNVSSQRYFINVYDVDGNWIVTTPLVATPPARAVDSAVFDPLRNIVLVKMVNPSTWPIPLGRGTIKPGWIVELTMLGFQPDAYNGTRRCVGVNDITFTFPIDTDPGPVLIFGSANRLINMVEGYFNTSALIYRNGAFEVHP